jgi:hypothetical protein
MKAKKEEAGEACASHTRAQAPDSASREMKKDPPAKKRLSGKIATKPQAPKKDRGDADAHGADVEEAFERFWAIYPRKVEQDDARSVFAKAIAKDADADIVINGAAAYAAVRAAQISGGDPPKYTLYPATWLKKRKWTDALPPGVPIIDEAGTTVGFEESEQPQRGGNRGIIAVADEAIEWIKENLVTPDNPGGWLGLAPHSGGKR